MMTVKDSRGNTHELTARLEAILAIVIENAGDIVKPQNAQIVFDCAGGKVSASIRSNLESPRPEPA